MPSAALLRQGVQPVETHEVVEAVAAVLAGYAPFLAHLGAGDGATGAKRLHAVALPLRDADGEEAAAAPAWCLVREQAEVGPGGPPERPSGLVSVRIQVQVNLDPAAAPDPHEVLATAHTLALRALQGRLLDVTVGGGRFASTAPVTRTDRPSPPRLDKDRRSYSSAYYQAAVRPLAPQHHG